MERDPLPNFEALRAAPAGRDRVRKGLKRLYDWYSRNAGLAACVLRDAEDHALMREAVELRMGRPYGRLERFLVRA